MWFLPAFLGLKFFIAHIKFVYSTGIKELRLRSGVNHRNGTTFKGSKPKKWRQTP